MNNDIDRNPPTEIIGRVFRKRTTMFSRCAFSVDQHPTRDQVLLVGLPCIRDYVCRDAPTQQVVCLDLSRFQSDERLESEGFRRDSMREGS